MTLNNIRDLLLMNNRELLNRINNLKYTVEVLVGIDISDIQKELNEISKLVEKIIKEFDALDNDLIYPHISDTEIHVTQDDKDLWNAILENAKEYAKSLFDGVTSFKLKKVDALPTENIENLVIYLVPNGDSDTENCYDEYMYINGSWETIGSTRIDLTPYILKEEVYDLLEKYVLKKDSHTHQNLSVLDELSDIDGRLKYKDILLEVTVTDEEVQKAIADTLKILLNKEE